MNNENNTINGHNNQNLESIYPLSNLQEDYNIPASGIPPGIPGIVDNKMDVYKDFFNNSKIMSSFTSIGFFQSELYSLFEDFNFESRNISSFDEDELYISLLLHVYHSNVTPITDLNVFKINRDNKLDPSEVFKTISGSNHSLIEEIDVLNSIFEGCISVTYCRLLSQCCVSIDFTIDPRTSDIHCEEIITIRIFIFRALEYPSNDSIVLGWIVLHNNINYQSENNAIRRLSIEAMAFINGLLGNESPVIFDFISFCQTNLLLITESFLKTNTPYDSSVTTEASSSSEHIPSNVKKVDNIVNDKNVNKVEKANIQSIPKTKKEKKLSLIDFQNLQVEETVTKISPPIINTSDSQSNIKLTGVTSSRGNNGSSYSSIPEYRVALLASLNKGLVGREAKEDAINNLEYILPTSQLDYIRLEVQKEEDLLDKSVDIEQLGTRGEIESVKMLLGQLDIPKIKAKALLSLAKKNLIESDRRTSRTVDKMKSIWVEEAVKCFILRQEKSREKQSKRQLAVGATGVRRVMTIRDAYEKMEESIASSKTLQLSKPTSNSIEEFEDDDGDIIPHEEIPQLKKVTTPDQQTAPIIPKSSISTAGPNNVKFTADQCESAKSLRSTANAKPSKQGDLKMNNSNIDRELSKELSKKKNSPKYKAIVNVRSALPAHDMREEIVNIIKSNRVVIICGAPGCGKTTQVPQFVLDAAIEEGYGSKVTDQMNLFTFFHTIRSTC